MCDDEPTMPEVEEEECVCTPVEKPKKIVIEDKLPCTCPYDPRFPNTNTTVRCFYNFVEYQRCTRLLGAHQGCRIFKVCYERLCPVSWYEKWYEQLEKGTFPRCIYPPKTDNVELPDESEPFETAGY